jgi:hypothetical protein
MIPVIFLVMAAALSGCAGGFGHHLIASPSRVFTNRGAVRHAHDAGRRSGIAKTARQSRRTRRQRPANGGYSP